MGPGVEFPFLPLSRICPGRTWGGGGDEPIWPSEVGGLCRGATGKDPSSSPGAFFREGSIIERTLCWEGNTGFLEPCQPPAFRLFGFVCFLGLFFFSFFFGLIVLIKSFCPVLLFTGLTMLRGAQRGFLCFCPSSGLGGGLASCCELLPWQLQARWALRGGQGEPGLTSAGEEARGQGLRGSAWEPRRRWRWREPGSPAHC